MGWDGLDAQIVVGEEIDDLLDVALKVFPKRLEPGPPFGISGDGGDQTGDGSLVEFKVPEMFQIRLS